MLNYVTLTGTLPNAAGALAVFTPSNWLNDPTDQQTEPPAPVPVKLTASTVNGIACGVFSVSLLATDNANLPAGWYWTVNFSGIAGVAAYSFSFNLAHANGATQDISTLATLPSPVPITPYMPVPSGTPVAGQVPVATAIGEGSAWGNVATNPLNTLGDLPYGGSSGTLTRLAGDTSNTRKFLREQSSAGVAQAPAWDTIQAADVPTLNQNTTGTAANITATLDLVPAPAANVSLNSKKITGLAAGTVSTDAAQYGQTPAGGAIVSGQYLAVPNVYAPATQATPSVSTTTLAAFDSTHINTGSFTAPPSGSVVVTFSISGQASTTNVYTAFGVAAHGTVSPVVANVIMAKQGNGNAGPQSLVFVVTGLTSGTSYNFDLLGAVSTGNFTIQAFGQISTTPTMSASGGAPVTATVQAV